MGKSKSTFWETVVSLAGLGALAILWILAVEVGVLVIAILVGVLVGTFHGWVAGGLAALIIWAVIHKILWYCDIFDMIRSRKRGTVSCDPEVQVLGEVREEEKKL